MPNRAPTPDADADPGRATPEIPISEIKADLFRALSHPARIRILEVLADGERSVGYIAPLVGIESSHLSQQLAVLRRAGLVSTRKQASSVFYAIRDPATVELLVVAKRILINSLAGSTQLLAGLRSVSADR